MGRHYTEMKKGNKTISAECFSKDLMLEWIEQQKKVGFKVVYSTLDV